MARIIEPLVQIYGRLLEIRAQKGKTSLWPGEWYKHPFRGGVEVLGVQKSGWFKLQPGDLIIVSQSGKKLWKYFNYGEEDL